MEEIMTAAEEHGLWLEPSDFTTVDGVLSIDGMPADQWLNAMTEV